MPASNCRVRRATLEDVGALLELWKSMGFPVEDLAKRITEFQVVESAEGKLMGAVALHIAQRQGCIHSEAFRDFAQADALRPLLWERLLSVATNHGLHRLWTRESAPFWGQSGLVRADAEILGGLPLIWRGSNTGWLTLKLKEDVEEVLSADKEFALFMEAERNRTQRTLQQARILKGLALLIGIVLLGLVIAGVFFVLRSHPQLRPR